jgi:plasmid maintenance system antidote protein VapI
MAPPPPGAFIRDEILDELGLTVSEAAKALDVRRATLSDLINGTLALPRSSNAAAFSNAPRAAGST